MASGTDVATSETSLMDVESELEIHVQQMVAPEGHLFEAVVPEWLKGRTLGNNPNSGLDFWRLHGVLVLSVNQDFSVNPTMPLVGGELLLLGFTSEALSGLVQLPQGDSEKDCDWVFVHEWLRMKKALYSKPVPLVAIIHRAMEGKQLAALNLQERFAFTPKVIGILRTGSGAEAEKAAVVWFPGGSDIVWPGDRLLCHADAIDVQLLQLKLDSAFKSDRHMRLSLNLLLRKKLAQAREDIQRIRLDPEPQVGYGYGYGNRSASPISPRCRSRSRSQGRRMHRLGA
jgi:hypothetical protein